MISRRFVYWPDADGLVNQTSDGGGDLITVNIICVHDYEKNWRIRGSCDML